jgi:hypothetical protein
MSRGLVISLGVSALSCTLLFLYFRNKITNIERKVDVMFDLIQNHEQQQESHVNNIRESYPTSNDAGDNDTNQENWSNTAQDDNQDDKIMVSEDDDSEEISDSDEEDSDDEEEVPKLSLANTENITLSVSDVKKVTVQEIGNNNNNLNDLNDLNGGDSLDEIDIDEDDEDNEGDEEDDNDVSKIVLKKINADEDKLSDDVPDNSENDDTEIGHINNEDDEVDYNKLKVSELKSLAENMGLTNYKSLKKGPLVDLIKSRE